jgi:endonuclease/exonuclease/phosphatase (EEP) superfamily protein YafD
MIARVLWLILLLTGAVATLAGLLAPLHPPADVLNHFRPFVAAGAIVLLGAGLTLRAPRPVWGGAALLVGLNAVLLALPLWWSAAPADRPTSGQALASARDRNLTLVTFNTAFGEAQAIAAFLLREDPDIAVLQEVGARQLLELRALLRHRYPHSHACVARGCAAAIFTKRPWAAAGQEHWTQDVPETIWIQLDDPGIGRLRVVGVHLALPYRAEAQTRHVERLIALRASIDGPVIIAGDFNMTPWSYRLQRLLASAGLRRHATFLRSWPTDRYPQPRPPAPAFLIDHVLTTPGIRSVSIRTGPVVGSDHLPVVARLRLPPGRSG